MTNFLINVLKNALTSGDIVKRWDKKELVMYDMYSGSIITTEKLVRKVKKSLAAGTRPSDVARVMSDPYTGRWREDLLPRMHIVDALSEAKESRHLSNPNTVVFSQLGICARTIIIR